MKPAWKIETYTGAALDYTLTDNVSTIRFKDVLTDGVGTFTFTMPTKYGTTYKYYDIALHDKVKIYVDWDTVPATPNFIGYITSISAPLMTSQGWIRIINGLSQGEILLRRFKTDTRYSATNASTIVSGWATDLGLGVGDITADTNQPSIEVQTKTYFDLLQEISDFWIDGAHQIKKDFFVDTDFDLVWKTRPIRTVGVETLTVGDTIETYDVLRDVNTVKNSIVVYGAQEKNYPLDGDLYTEQDAAETPADDGWSSSGALSWNSTNPAVGSESVQATLGATTQLLMDNTFPGVSSLDLERWKKNSYKTFSMRFRLTADPDSGLCQKVIHFWLPDINNRLFTVFSNIVTSLNNWGEIVIPLGPDTTQPWWTVGSPDWSDCTRIRIDLTSLANGLMTCQIDGMHFADCRYRDTASDAASIAAYGQRDLEVIDDKLRSDSQCGQRAETLLYQQKDPPTQITVMCKGNSNILIGDRLPMTIPAENISAANYDVFEVENFINTETGGWKTKGVMVDSGDIRKTRENTSAVAISNLKKFIRLFAIDEKSIQ